MELFMFYGCIFCGRVLSGPDSFDPVERRNHRCRKMPEGREGMSQLVAVKIGEKPRSEDKLAQPAGVKK